ncbi:MAG: septal ring lytic transglycosylase RlpA family protein [Thermoactinospora sp.]|nr:septal ring lytic transglycosylase RlpA family protein [Thermoactinospora sp.]
MATAGSRATVSPTASKPTPTESTPSKSSAASPSQASSDSSKSSDSSASTNKPESASSPKPKSSESAKSKKPEATGPRVVSTGTCGASFYGDPQMTASGEQFDPTAMTAAHKSLPLGSKVRVTNPNNGDSVTVRINDRGPYIGGRCLDLSEAAFDAIGDTGAGVMTVKYEVLAS